MFLSVVLPFSWLLAFCFGCFCAEEKTSADSRLGFLLSMREMKMRLPWRGHDLRLRVLRKLRPVSNVVLLPC